MAEWLPSLHHKMPNSLNFFSKFCLTTTPRAIRLLFTSSLMLFCLLVFLLLHTWKILLVTLTLSRKNPFRLFTTICRHTPIGYGYVDHSVQSGMVNIEKADFGVGFLPICPRLYLFKNFLLSLCPGQETHLSL